MTIFVVEPKGAERVMRYMDEILDQAARRGVRVKAIKLPLDARRYWHWPAGYLENHVATYGGARIIFADRP